MDRIQQRLLAEWFEQEIHRATPQGSRAQLLVSVRGDENDRYDPMARHQAALQLEPAHSRHAHVEDQAVRLMRAIRAQELLGRSKRLHSKPDGPEQPPHRLTYGFVVVDDRDEREVRHRGPLRSLDDRRSAGKIHYT